jgi:nicotinamidase-related amidase
MTTLTDRPNTALLVIDVQNGVVAAATRRDAVIAAINALIGKARDEGVPVVWIQHDDEEMPLGSPEWRWVPELSRNDGEPLIRKQYGDSFEDTRLEEALAARKVGHLVIAGAASDMCIRATLHGGFARGYDVTLVGDAHTTTDLSEYGAPPPEQVIAHTNLYWNYQKAPGRHAATRSSGEVSFHAP